MASSEQEDSFVNRDTPIPVVQLHPADGSTPATLTPSTEHGSSHRLSASKLKDKLESLGDKSGRDSSNKMGDKMFNLYEQTDTMVFIFRGHHTNTSSDCSPKSCPQRISPTLLHQTAMMHQIHVSRTAALVPMSLVLTSPFLLCPPIFGASTPA
jgi:hypothetical protein